MTNNMVSEGNARSEQTDDWTAEQGIREAARQEPALHEAVAAIHERATEVAAATQLNHRHDLAVFKLKSKIKDLKLGFVAVLSIALLTGGFAGMFVYGEHQQHQVSLTKVRGALAEARVRLATGERAVASAKARAAQLEGDLDKQRAKTAAAVASAKAAREEAKRTGEAGLPKQPSVKPWAPSTVPSRPTMPNCHPKDPLCGDLGV